MEPVATHVRFEDAQQVLAAQPFSVLLGAELTAFGTEGAELRVPVPAQVRQQHGYAHGGLIAYAADNVVTFAAGAIAGAGVLTAELTINYVAPARGGELVARASVAHPGSRLVVTRCEVFDVDDDGSERLCALAQGTVARLV